MPYRRSRRISRPFRSRALLAGVCTAGLLAGGLLAGCGGSARPAPRSWAKSVCGALTPWRTEVANLTQRAQEEISRTGTPSQTKQSLTQLLAGAERASERARARIAGAGVPDVAGGRATADRFVAALTRARNAYGHTRATIAGLDAAAAKPFYDAVEQAFKQLGDEYSGSVLDFNSVAPAALHQAFDEVSECR